MEPTKGITLCLRSLFSAWMEPLWGPFAAGGVGSALFSGKAHPAAPFHRPCSNVLALELLEELTCANPPGPCSVPVWHCVVTLLCSPRPGTCSSTLDDPGRDGTSETWPEGTHRVGAERRQHSGVAELSLPHLLGRSGPGCSSDRDTKVVADGRMAAQHHPPVGRARGLARRRWKGSSPCCPRRVVEVRESPTLLSSLPLSQGFARYG